MDMSQLFNLPANLLGVGAGFGVSFLLDLVLKKKARPAERTDEDLMRFAKLEADLASAREQADQLPDLHAYSRKLEAKVQALEASGAEADPEAENLALRVQVLEDQLRDKADLEARLAMANQQIEDLKGKASLMDEVLGSKQIEELNERVPTPTFHESAPVEIPLTAAAEVVVAPELAVAPGQEAEKQLEAVAKSEPMIEVVENNHPVSDPVPSMGSVAPALEEPPVLRLEESAPTPATALNPPLEREAKDPLEKIDGIGKIYQQKLYEAGIKTFAQLAAASPSRITEVIEPQNWQTIDVMKWRREAALFAAGEKE
jgi:predicted flap endonuclease-1-like 5' DNA nuclease